MFQSRLIVQLVFKEEPYLIFGGEVDKRLRVTQMTFSENGEEVKIEGGMIKNGDKEVGGVVIAVILFGGLSCCLLEVEERELGEFEVRVIDGSSVVLMIHQ
jgi:hypothetical protein